jgi:hypothetical protein
VVELLLNQPEVKGLSFMINLISSKIPTQKGLGLLSFFSSFVSVGAVELEPLTIER